MLDTGRKAPRKASLTDLGLKSLKPSTPGARETVWDALLPGHAVRISAKGQKSFYAVRRRRPTDPNPVWYKLGVYPKMSLSEAREKAREALLALGKGEHPRILAEAARREEAEAERAADEGNFGTIAERFIREYLPRIKSAKTYEARIRRELLPEWDSRQITEITRRDVIRVLQAVKTRSGPAAALGIYAVLRKLFGWSIALDLLENSPAAAIKTGDVIGASNNRDRLLSNDEIAKVWRAIDKVGEPFATVYRLLLLTGCRREEIAAAKWEEFNEQEATLYVPPERAKNGDALLIPLSPTAVQLIADMPRFTGGSFIFTTTGGRAPISGFAIAKQRLDGLIAKQGDVIPPFVIHDFRRAVRSNLGRLGIATHVAELCIGHRQKGIVAVYDQYTYLDERRAALRQWEARLLPLISPPPVAGAGEKIVALSQRRA